MASFSINAGGGFSCSYTSIARLARELLAVAEFVDRANESFGLTLTSEGVSLTWESGEQDAEDIADFFAAQDAAVLYYVTIYAGTDEAAAFGEHVAVQLID